ncbi:MAG: fibronectin type III domain-containing protein [Acidobacteriota bacterium]|nr:fibronectin type III domain-containing protein [Acidobacteriota bacterium]
MPLRGAGHGTPCPYTRALALPLALWLCLSLSGCARIADPKPPEAHVPAAVGDLVARQVASQVVLTFSPPAKNTGGTATGTGGTLEIFRLAEKSGHAPLTEESFLGQATHILSIPAARFPEYLRDGVFVVTDAPPDAHGGKPGDWRFRYAVAFANARRQTGGLGSQAVIRLMQPPPVPQGLAATVAEDGISIRWTPPPAIPDDADGSRVAGYNVYRAEEPGTLLAKPLNITPIKPITPLGVVEYRDGDFQFDKTYYYSVSAIGDFGEDSGGDFATSAEGARSEALAVEVRDVFPPAPPENLTVVAEEGSVTLFWTPSPSRDVAGYRIFRKKGDGAAWERLQPELVGGLSHRDAVAGGGSAPDMVYGIEAVDKSGNASNRVVAPKSNNN